MSYQGLDDRDTFGAIRRRGRIWSLADLELSLDHCKRQVEVYRVRGMIYQVRFFQEQVEEYQRRIEEFHAAQLR